MNLTHKCLNIASKKKGLTINLNLIIAKSLINIKKNIKFMTILNQIFI